MARPNLASTSLTINADTAIQIATTSLVDVTWPIGSVTAVPANHLYVVDAIYASNYHATQDYYATFVHKRGGVEYSTGPKWRVPAGQMINLLLGKNLNLNDGDILRIKADGATVILFSIPFSDIS